MGVPWRLRSYQEKQAVIKTFRFYTIFFVSLFVLYQSTVVLFARPYTINSVGMHPTIEPGDLFIISPMPWWMHGQQRHMPKRGEIILFESPGEVGGSIVRGLFEPFLRFITLQQWGFGSEKRKEGMPEMLLKRAIALPGDWVKIENGHVYVRPRGSRYFVSEFESSSQIYELKEAAPAKGWKDIALFSSDFPAFQLGINEVFVIGDNRGYINDSRSFGPISLEQIKGRVMTIYWPPKKMNKIEKKRDAIEPTSS